MSRPAEFDRDEVLQHAMQVFWQQGYNATSVKDLTDATRLKPGSLYGAFKSKRQLFLEAIDVYFEQIQAFVHRTLHADAPPLVRIRNFFEQLMKECSLDRDVKGCLLVNTLLEIPAEDTQINRHVGQMFGFVETEFRKVLEEAIDKGELDPEKDPVALARLLVAGIYGLRVYNQTRPGKKALKSIVDALLSVLE